MKKLICLTMAAILVLSAASCKKEVRYKKYGIDGVTPLPEAIDIGTVVNGKVVKWGSFNLGASKVGEYGDYYAWGETEPKDCYTWETYSFASEFNKITKYCPKYCEESYWDFEARPEGTDGIIEMLPEDNAVLKKLGGKWRMPNHDDVLALLDLKKDPDCKWEYSEQGLRITRISTGKSLLFPPAGCYKEKPETGNHCGFWIDWICSSNPSLGQDIYIMIDLQRAGYLDHDGDNRYLGLPIRPVYEE